MLSITRILKTSIIRLSLIYFVIFLLSGLIVVGSFYWYISKTMIEDSDRIIASEIIDLGNHYKNGGVRKLIEAIRTKSDNTNKNIYLIFNIQGKIIAGNLKNLPSNIKAGNNVFLFNYEPQDTFQAYSFSFKDDETRLARARIVQLSTGYIMLVGTDVQEIKNLLNIIYQLLLSTLILTTIMSLLFSVFMGKRLLKRIDSFNLTSQAIIEGRLDQRIPLSGSGDEFDRLADNLNNMLSQIEKLMLAMQEVTTNIAHDLKTPLTRMRNRLEDILGDYEQSPLKMDKSEKNRDYKSHSEQKEKIEASIKDADSLIKTFSSLLNIAKLNADIVNKDFHNYKLKSIIADIFELYEAAISAEGFDYNLDIDENIDIKCDKNLISQALSNLIENSLKYGKNTKSAIKPLIEVSAKIKYKNIEITFADNGDGIAKDKRQEVFKRFYKLDNSRTENGSGLGLSMVEAIINLHKGNVSIAKNDIGTHFLITLPSNKQ